MPATTGEGFEVGLISQVRALEDLKSAIAGAQARAAIALDTSRRKADAAAGLPPDQRARSVGAEIALARRESPNQGSRLLGLARVLTTDMPHTLTALDTGELNEWRATTIVREVICLSAENRHAVDAELAADQGTLNGVGTQSVKNRARALAYRLEPHTAVTRARKAATERYVSCRPAPDTMAYFTALLPAADAISAYAALSRDADTRTGTGDAHGRGRGQIMADTLVERLTGTPAGTIPTSIELIMTDCTLFHGGSEPAYLPGYGIIPAQHARDLTRNNGNSGNTGNNNKKTSDGNDRSSGGSSGRDSVRRPQ